jgi:regulator of RNase E activity RraA
MSAICRICGIKSDGSAVANYVRRVVIKNVGGTTALVGTVETVGTDIEDNASTDVAITADNTNDALQINVTGIAAETWRWVAVVEGLEIAYGT